MVDINLIGDDKTGEEERVDDFTQTSSMDTQELAFEERTETFDTTKTAGFSQKRNYSSLIATLIIMAVIILLGSSIYFFMFSDDQADEAAIPDFQASSDEVVTSEPVDDPELRALEEEFAQDMQDFEQSPGATQQPQQTTPEAVTEPEVSQPVERQQPTRQPEPTRTQQPARGTTRTVNAGFVASTHEAVESVSSLLSQVPSDLSTTLLSFTGQRVRMELVGGSTAAVSNFASRLNQSWGGANFEVVAESQIEGNGALLDKALISGRIASSASSANGSVRFMTQAQVKDWMNKTARQFGLSVRELTSQQGTFDGGFQKTPMMARIYGNQSALVGFLEELSNQSLNLELVKILLVSPDMINYTDDNLILVLNMLLYEQ